MKYRRFKQILKRMYWLPGVYRLRCANQLRLKLQWFTIMGRVGLIKPSNYPFSNICQLGLSINLYFFEVFFAMPIIKLFNYTYNPDDYNN
jgi:hypothetical protein